MKLAQIKNGVVARLAAPNDSDVRSYRTLRTAVGLLGILLPFVASLSGWLLPPRLPKPSISAYYYTDTRDFFVGMLCAIGVFLVCYRGPQKIDEVVSALAGVFAVGVAWLPTKPEGAASPAQELVSRLHYASAALFFSAITFMALFLFTKGDTADPAKRRRNVLYRACGITMATCIAVMLVQAWFFPGSKETWKAHGITFVLETISIEAFGIAWLVKGAAG